MEFAERLDGLMVGAADADFVAGDALDFVREGELMPDIQGSGEGVVLETRDAEQTPPMMGDQLDLLRLGFGSRIPFVAEAGEEVIEIGDGSGG